MIRKIILIDKEKCNGCGLCVTACHEEAIGLVDGKAELLRDDYCDGLGNCLPACPTGAITFEQREAMEYDEKAVLENKLKKQEREEDKQTKQQQFSLDSCLNQWPVQIKLVPVNAAYFENAHLLIAADCTAYAYGNFHNQFIKNKAILVGCPKLDSEDYSEKLMKILRENTIKSITLVRMEVPCCGGLELAVKKALVSSGKMIPWHIHVIGIDGKIKEEY